MSATYRSHSTASTNQLTADQLTIDRPVGAVQGDVLVAILSMGVGTNALDPLTAPSGWVARPGYSAGTFSSSGVYARVYTKTMGANEPASYTWTWTYDRDNEWLHAVIIAASGADASNPILASAWSASSGTNAIAPSLTPSESGALLVCTYMGGGRGAWGTPAGMTELAEFDKGGSFGAMTASAPAPSGGTATGDKISVTNYDFSTAYGGSYLIRAMPNSAPNAPIITSPVDGEVLNKDVSNVFEAQASDPDSGDSTSQSWWRTRLTGVGAAWETVTKISPVTIYEFPAGTFSAGDYEVQAATRDAAGEPVNEADLKWSASTFFKAATAPPKPQFTDPVNGATIGQSSYEAVISAPALVASRWRTVADDGTGNPDTSTVLSAAVTKTTGDLRRHLFEFPVNNRTEHLQSQIQNSDGLWSSWASSRNPISYTPPPTPSRVLVNQGTSLRADITNPTPATGEPAVAYNEVWVDDGNGKGEQLRATVNPNLPWTYHTPRSGRHYDGSDGTSLRVVAVATNGTRTSS